MGNNKRIKIKMIDNMLYTYKVLDNISTFNSDNKTIENELLSGLYKDITEKNHLYLELENKIIKCNDIKEIFITR